MDIPASLYPAIGAVIAALVAGWISFVVTVLTKEQKTSEFRQAWIDGLRNDLSDLIGTVATLGTFVWLKNITKSSDPEHLEFLEKNLSNVNRTDVSYHRILMRLNPEEHEMLATRLEELISDIHNPSQVGFDHRIDAAIQEAQKVLKTEWKRVKKGELIFRLIKYGSLASFLIGVAFAVLVSQGYVFSVIWTSLRN